MSERKIAQNGGGRIMINHTDKYLVHETHHNLEERSWDQKITM